MDIIRLENITYEYTPEIKVFEGLDFALKSGERVGIMGANGSGKTTLFSLIMGLRLPQQGKVVLFGENREAEKDFADARKRIGYLFQDPDDQVFCPTVEEDISFGPLNLGLDLTETRKRVKNISEDLGITALRQRITTKLSWGQKRLVSLAGILAMSPDVLILDEPTASIDDNVIERITDYLKNTCHSLLIASHDRDFLEALCPRIYILKNSRFILKSQ